MLSMAAFNAILKTLEEPPSYVIFILATTEAHKIPITILSRCQRYDFKRISVQTIMDRMQELITAEGADVEEEALRYIAKEAVSGVVPTDASCWELLAGSSIRVVYDSTRQSVSFANSSEQTKLSYTLQEDGLYSA